jgi:hypothetical protein
VPTKNNIQVQGSKTLSTFAPIYGIMFSVKERNGRTKHMNVCYGQRVKHLKSLSMH